MSILGEFIHWLPEYFFPKICAGCETEGWHVCPKCYPTVESVLENPVCPSCNRPAIHGLVHPRCPQRGKLDGLISFYRYQGWAKEIIKSAKFGRNRYFRPLVWLSEECGKKLASINNRGKSELMRKMGMGVEAGNFQPPNPSPLSSAVLPVPLHWWRRRKRGYNQAELIAKAMAAQLGMPLNTKLLYRTRHTDTQSLTLEATDRRKNVKGAFTVKARQVYPQSILLIDDVWTTGATMQECCRVLKFAGVKRVWGVTLLRA